MFFAAFLFLALCACPFATADETTHETTDTISLDELPEPPSEIAKLVEDAKASFYSGRKPWEETKAARERTGVTQRGKRLAGETKFKLQYDFRSNTKWRVRREKGKRILVMTVTYSRADLKHSHEIWFRRRPYIKNFWDDRLVQHELDHVRISMSSVVGSTFLKNLKDSRILRREISESQQVDKEIVQKFVDEHVEEVFQEIVSLVSIRYKELDRVTDHGLNPIPNESKIRGWLN